MDWPILIPAAFLSRDQGFQPKPLESALPELKIGSAECDRLKRNCSKPPAIAFIAPTTGPPAPGLFFARRYRPEGRSPDIYLSQTLLTIFPLKNHVFSAF
jgi:hypothetical protein